MKPLLIHAHRKPITWIKFSKEGDLLFISAKDGLATVFYTENGEMLGSFEHSGAVGCIDASDDSARVLTASSDNEAVLWNVKTGQRMVTYEQRTPVRFVQFAEGCRKFLCVMDKGYGFAPAIHIYQLGHDVMTIDSLSERRNTDQPIVKVAFNHTEKINCAMFGPLNKTIIVAMDDGTVRCYDAETGDKLGEVKEHNASVNKISFSRDKLLFATAGADMVCKLFETKTLELIKTYRATEPLNTAAISPSKHHVLMAGGTQAENVTTTLARSSTFDIHFFNMIYEEEIGKVKGHFGPVHFVTFSPDGTQIVSGGEDGFVRLFTLTEDAAYSNLKDDASA